MISAISRDGIITTYEPEGKDVIVLPEKVGKLKKEYVVRLIRNEGHHKSCIAEEVFNNEPNETQVLWCLINHKDASFAVKSERYLIDHNEFDCDDLPFR